MEVNHKEAFELAGNIKEKSGYTSQNVNLARSYLEMHALLNTVWHAMNDDRPPSFPMKEIESVLWPNG